MVLYVGTERSGIFMDSATAKPNKRESILGKVLDSKRAEGHVLNPTEIIDMIINHALEQREREIVRQRHGLGQASMTLDAIGRRLGITRERVRQIAKQALSKLGKAKRVFDEIHLLDLALKEILEKSGGLKEETSLMKDFFGDKYTDEQRLSLLFFIKYLSELVSKASFKKPGWQLIGAPVDLHKALEDMVHEHVQKFESPQSIEVLHEALSSEEAYLAWREKFIEAWPHKDTEHDWLHIVRSYLQLSDKVDSNPFDEWGVASSAMIKPRRMGDKIYLVLKRHKEPLHFNKITELINDYGFDKRVAYRPTVHNELILDPRFVLVGRGIYALKEWGYSEGTVSDVIKQILSSSDQPMTREEIIESVLQERVVKEGTILLALTNKKNFRRLPDGRYTCFNLI